LVLVVLVVQQVAITVFRAVALHLAWLPLLQLVVVMVQTAETQTVDQVVLEAVLLDLELLALEHQDKVSQVAQQVALVA
jgi:hypothetical protein